MNKPRRAKVLTIDFETRGVLDLRAVGAWNYAKHPLTEILILAYKLPGRYVKLWTPAREFPSDLRGCLEGGGPVEAHNAFFERCIWHHIGIRRHGFPEIAPEQWRCSAAKAAMHALPRHLDGACEALGTRHQKDKVGYALMMKMSKPRKLTKSEVISMAGLSPKAKKREIERARDALEGLSGPFWHESPADLRRLALYCGRDVLAEHALSSELDDLPPEELRLFHLMNQMNWDGVHCDLDCAKAAIETMAELTSLAEQELAVLTGGLVQTVNQGAKIKDWAGYCGYPLPDIQKATIIDALDDPRCPERVKEVLRIRQAYGRSSVTKYKAFIDRADPDDWRIRDHQRYHGARTGRVAGQGIQTQNFPRPDPGIKFEQVKRAIRAVKLRDSELFAGLFDDPASMLSAAIRPTICAGPGKSLYCIDYSSIEAVLTLWFCDDPGLDLIKQGLCIYRDLAGEIYGIEDAQSIPKKSEERQHGKIGVLGCGYGMGPPKLKMTAKIQWGANLSLDFCKQIVTAYRKKYAKVPEMWRKLQKAMTACVWNKENVDVHRGVGFEWAPPFVTLRLMSGRRIYYYKPEIRIELAPWGDEVPCVYYWGENSQTKQWELQKTYGGKELDHVIQGAARDLMCDAALKVEEDPDLGKLVMTVHDELVYEVDDRLGDEHGLDLW